MPWSMPRGGPSSSSSRPARPMTAEARSICWTVWAREISCWLTAPTTPTLCVRRSRNAAPGRASNQCPDASTLRLSVPFFIVTETSSSASSTNSSTSAPSPRDTKNTPTTTSHSSSSLPSEYGCDLMSLCLSLLYSLWPEGCRRNSSGAVPARPYQRPLHSSSLDRCQREHGRGHHRCSCLSLSAAVPESFPAQGLPRDILTDCRPFAAPQCERRSLRPLDRGIDPTRRLPEPLGFVVDGQCGWATDFHAPALDLVSSVPEGRLCRSSSSSWHDSGRLGCPLPGPLY